MKFIFWAKKFIPERVKKHELAVGNFGKKERKYNTFFGDSCRNEFVAKCQEQQFSPVKSAEKKIVVKNVNGDKVAELGLANAI